MNDHDKQTILEELISLSRPKTREDCPQPNITAREYAEHEGIDPATAYKRLMRGVQRGIYEYEDDVLIDTHLAHVFWASE